MWEVLLRGKILHDYRKYQMWLRYISDMRKYDSNIMKETEEKKCG